MSLARKRVSALVLVSLILALLAGAGIAVADEGKAIRPFNGKDLDGWKVKGSPSVSKWTVGIAKVNPAKPGELIADPADGKPGEMVNPIPHSLDIYTEQKFGDASITLELMVPRGSNSGVYVMGEYEIQVLDSYGRKQVGPGDMGGIYGANAPRVNACKKPGEWQKMEIEYQAPRFENGKKVANAKMLKVVLNGQVIHENVEMKQQTPGGVTGREAAEGPLMFQGNHGPVAYRNIEITPSAKK
jgi:hypothetical protein